MKKVTLVFNVLLIIIGSLMIVERFDLKDAEKYHLFQPNLTLKITESDGLTGNELNDILLNLSPGSNLKKIFYRDGFNAVFLNESTYENLINHLGNLNFNISLANECTELCFIATYDTGEPEQLALISDFRDNHNYRFYIMNDMVELGYTLFGSYEIQSLNLAQDTAFLQNLIDTDDVVGEISTEPQVLMTQRGRVSDTILFGLIIVLLSLFLYSTIYDYYKQIRESSILKLMGYSIFDIYFRIVRVTACVIVLTQVLLLALFGYMFRNSHFLIELSLCFAVLDCLYLIVSGITIATLNANNDIVLSLKNRPLTTKLVSIAMYLKLGLGFALLVLGFNSYNNIERTLISYNEGLRYEPIFNVARFNGYRRLDIDDDTFFERVHNFYPQLLKTKDIDYVIANFYEYYPLTNPDAYYGDTDIDIRNKDLSRYTDGSMYAMGEVDRNYLKKFNVEAVDEDGNIYNLDESLQEYSILIPKSKLPELESIKEFSESFSMPHSYQLSNTTFYPIKYYFYNDMDLPSLDPYINPDLFISSPILYVIDGDTILDFRDGGTLILGGDSAIKFFLRDSESKVSMYEQIAPILKSNSLNLHIDQSLFISYGDEFGQISNIAIQKLTNELTGITIIAFIYIMTTLLMNKLQFEEERQDIIVKYNLGFKKREAFNKLSSLNTIVLIGSIILACVVIFFTGRELTIKILVPVLAIVFIEKIILNSFIESTIRNKRKAK